MSDFAIFNDSAADLSESYVKINDITVIPYYITFGGLNYFRENVDLTHDEFYSQISRGIIPQTTSPSVKDYFDAFKTAVDQGKKVICFCLSSKLASSYKNACLAANEFNKWDRVVYVIDSWLASAAQGLLVNEAVHMKYNGLEIEEVVRKSEEIKKTGEIMFVIDDLTYLEKGGRIGKADAFLGTLLNIKPVIMLKFGELLPLAKVVGRKNAVAKVKKRAASNMLKYGNYSSTILNFKEIGDVDGFAQGIHMTMSPFSIGSTIGSHVGTTAAGIAYIKRYD